VTPTPSPTPTAPVVAGGQGGAGTASGDPEPRDPNAGDPAPQADGAPAPTAPPESAPFRVVLPEPAAIIGNIVDGVSQQVAATVRPAAVVAVAQAFTFPLILMVAVLLFLIGQWRMDDPKFRMAPLSRAETTISFEEA
jgi:hypothetical protein